MHGVPADIAPPEPRYALLVTVTGQPIMQIYAFLLRAYYSHSTGCMCVCVRVCVLHAGTSQTLTSPTHTPTPAGINRTLDIWRTLPLGESTHTHTHTRTHTHNVPSCHTPLHSANILVYLKCCLCVCVRVSHRRGPQVAPTELEMLQSLPEFKQAKQEVIAEEQAVLKVS